MKTVRELLDQAADDLRSCGVETPFLDAEILLSRTLNVSRTEVLVHPEREIPSETAKRYNHLVSRRARREPLPYIIGEREFFGLCFEVAPGVLIPRPETETLVEVGVQVAGRFECPTILDVGLGSGAVAISIAQSLENAIVYGTESSPSALEIARRNAGRMSVANRTRFLSGDLFEPLSGLVFDVIVSNPPYIPTLDIETLQPEISMYEPREALDGGEDGLDYFRRLTMESVDYLKPDGVLAVEVGADQSPAVEALFGIVGLHNIRSVRDLIGIERVVLGERLND